MARFLALLLIGPWLIVLGLLYWLYSRRRVANGVSPRFDAGVLLVAVLVAAGGAAFGYRLSLGLGVIWQQVTAPLFTYMGFNIVVFCGLLRHWLANKRHVAV